MGKPRRSGGFLADVLPPKVEGRHRFVISAVYPLTPGEAAAMQGGGQLNLDPERFVAVPIITCGDCNEMFIVAKDEPCQAGDAWRAIEPIEPQPEETNAP